jgi:hypothetical protein
VDSAGVSIPKPTHGKTHAGWPTSPDASGEYMEARFAEAAIKEVSPRGGPLVVSGAFSKLIDLSGIDGVHRICLAAGCRR